MPKYIDSGELVEILNLEEERDHYKDSISCIKEYLKHITIKSRMGAHKAQVDIVVYKCRSWLHNFINNPKCKNAICNYIEIFEAIEMTQDDYTFLKAFEANVHLMWD